jgi:large subunit ribosomal protein L29
MKDDELREALAEAKAERFNLRFQLATNQLDNHARIKDVKGDIARILTVLRERELASVDAGAGGEERA